MNTAKTTYANTLFSAAFNAAEKVEFNAQYHNGTGYFDRMTKIEVPAGEVRACLSDDNRRIVLLGTIVGTIAVFDRYSDQSEEVNPVFVYNARSSKTLKYLIGGSALTDDDMWKLLNTNGSNAVNKILCSIRDDVNNVKEDEDD